MADSADLHFDADDPDDADRDDAGDGTDAESTPSRNHEIPAPFRDNLYAVVDELVDHEGLLVALDFDGTLAAIERRPEEATIPDPTREAVAALAAEPDVAVAVVSGRELADVRERVGLDSVSYAGNHGLEIRVDERAVHPTARSVRDTIADLCDRLGDELAEIDGAIVENKGVTATIHHRLVAEEAIPSVVDAVETRVEGCDDVRLTTGKDVLELRPAVDWDKGDAVRELYDELVPDGERWLPMYVGDDTTDEAAFSVLDDRGLGVKVGNDPATEAPYRVADPESVRAILGWLSDYGVEFLAVDHHGVPVGTA